MKNKYKTLVFFVVCDMLIAVLSVMFSFIITDQKPFLFEYYVEYTYICYPIAIVLTFYLFKIYNILWRYTGIGELLRIVAGSGLSVSLMYITVKAVFHINKFGDASFYIITFFLTVSLVYLQRLLYKMVDNKIHQAKKHRKFSYDSRISGNVLIIGAGEAGERVINEMMHKKEYIDCKIKGVIDDDPYKKGQYILGIRIVGGREMILEYAKKFDISVIVFAIPGCRPGPKSEILNICQQTGCKIKVVPAVFQLDNVSEITRSIRNIKIEDLLGREPIDLNLKSKMNFVKGKVILVTGGGGSIGSELCRQISAHEPKQLIIFDIYENNAYDIQNELKHNYRIENQYKK